MWNAMLKNQRATGEDLDAYKARVAPVSESTDAYYQKGWKDGVDVAFRINYSTFLTVDSYKLTTRK